MVGRVDAGLDQLCDGSAVLRRRQLGNIRHVDACRGEVTARRGRQLRCRHRRRVIHLGLRQHSSMIHWRVAKSDSRNVFSGIMYSMKHLIYTICSSHRNDHRTSSIDCDLQTYERYSVRTEKFKRSFIPFSINYQ